MLVKVKKVAKGAVLPTKAHADMVQQGGNHEV